MPFQHQHGPAGWRFATPPVGEGEAVATCVGRAIRLQLDAQIVESTNDHALEYRQDVERFAVVLRRRVSDGRHVQNWADIAVAISSGYLPTVPGYSALVEVADDFANANFLAERHRRTARTFLVSEQRHVGRDKRSRWEFAYINREFHDDALICARE